MTSTGKSRLVSGSRIVIYLKDTSGRSMQTSIFSVDVEDWFHILDVPSSPPISEWAGLPSHVEKNFTRKLLDIFSECNVQVTCFFLGWIGERYPAPGERSCRPRTRNRLARLRTSTGVSSRAAISFMTMSAGRVCCWRTLPAAPVLGLSRARLLDHGRNAVVFRRAGRRRAISTIRRYFLQRAGTEECARAGAIRIVSAKTTASLSFPSA